MALLIKISAAISMKKVHMALLSAIWLVASVQGLTDSQDVYALNQLYNSLTSPFLTGWSGSGGDPCAENWEGVACAGVNVTFLNLTGLSLTGLPGVGLQNLTALIVLDLSNNLLSGGLPVQLPPHVQQIDLSRNQFTGNLPLSFAELSNLNALNISTNVLSGTLADMFNSLGTLTTLDFSNNGFNGWLPPSFVALTSLTALYLEDNSFSGTIDVLGNLPITEIDISNNNFTGWIPSNLRNLSASIYTGNSFSTSPAPPPPPPSPPPLPIISPSSPVEMSPSGSKSRSIPTEKSPPSDKETKGGVGRYLTKGRLIGIAVAGLLAIIAMALIILFFASKIQPRERKHKYNTETSLHGNLLPTRKGQKQPYARARDEKREVEPAIKVVPSKTYKSSELVALKPPPVRLESLKLGKSKGSSTLPPPCSTGAKFSVAAHAYTISELQHATQSFAEESLIGEGTLGKVYKAQMPNGEFVAVKKLDHSVTRMGQENFLKILSTIARLRHVNVVQLVGYCVELGEHLLVYDYVGNGTLEENLHVDSVTKRKLDWKARVRIALGVAKALEYLHEKCKPAIFHRNLTSANVLLDNDQVPHLSDCGLANYFQHDQALAEHLGYSAPEHTSSGIYTTETDTYSFGVIMLELLTGRKPLDSTRPRSEQFLVRWAVPQLHDIDALDKMIDPAIRGAYSRKSVSRFADVISQCAQANPEFRPPMSEVVQCLERLQAM